MMVVDLVLKNGKGELKDCCIYDSNDRGILPIEDYDKLNNILSDTNKWVYFQNIYANGQCHTSNICMFTIKDVPEELL